MMMAFRFAPLALMLFTAPAFAHMGVNHDGCPANQSFSVGEINVTGAFTRAMLAGAPVAAGFMTIANAGDDDDRLIAATGEVSARIELHEMVVENDMMRMSEVEDGIAIPAGETVVLAPGGLHVMFIAPSQEFREGECVELTLVFEQAGALDVQLSVGPVGAAGPAMHDDHGHGDHNHTHDAGGD